LTSLAEEILNYLSFHYKNIKALSNKGATKDHAATIVEIHQAFNKNILLVF
jgi:hypothetical protein